MKCFETTCFRNLFSDVSDSAKIWKPIGKVIKSEESEIIGIAQNGEIISNEQLCKNSMIICANLVRRNLNH